MSQQILNKIQILTMEYKALQTPFPVLFPIPLSQHSPYTGLLAVLSKLLKCLYNILKYKI